MEDQPVVTINSPLKAIIFDADGTLLNSFELIMAAYRYIAEIHNLPEPDAELVRQQIGKPMETVVEALFPGSDSKALLMTNDEYVAANMMKTQAFAGISELLADLQARNLKLAILTNASSRVIDHLRHLGLDTYFTSIVHADRVARLKPSPEGFFLAVDECGVAPFEAVMVGDTAIDVMTGRAANALATIGITHGYGKREELIEAEADYIVDNLSAISGVIDGLIAG